MSSNKKRYWEFVFTRWYFWILFLYLFFSYFFEYPTHIFFGQAIVGVGVASTLMAIIIPTYIFNRQLKKAEKK